MLAWAPEVLIEYCTWLLPFGFGMVFGRSQKMPPNSWLVKLIATLGRTHPLILLMVTVAVFIVAHNPGLLLVTPLFIIALMKTADGLGSRVNRVVGELGKHSMYMWLTHSFYCYYFTQKLIFAPRYTPLILLLLIAVSYLTSLVLSRIELAIKGGVMKRVQKWSRLDKKRDHLCVLSEDGQCLLLGRAYRRGRSSLGCRSAPRCARPGYLGLNSKR